MDGWIERCDSSLKRDFYFIQFTFLGSVDELVADQTLDGFALKRLCSLTWQDSVRYGQRVVFLHEELFGTGTESGWVDVLGTKHHSEAGWGDRTNINSSLST